MIGLDIAMNVNEELKDIRNCLLLLKCELLRFKLERKYYAWVKSTKNGFRPGQLRDERGRWTEESGGAPSALAIPSRNEVFPIFADFESIPFNERIAKLLGQDSDESNDGIQTIGATITYDTARTGIPSIDETTQRLSDVLIEVMNRSEFIPERAGSAYGIAVHTSFAATVRSENLPGIGRNGVEQSFYMQEVARYGLAGSIRTDVVLRNVADEIIAIYDVKTGGAVLRPSRADELRERTKAGPYTPVIELHFRRGSSLKHESIEQSFGTDSAAAA